MYFIHVRLVLWTYIFAAHGYLYKKEQSCPKVILFLYILIYTSLLYLKECLIDKRGNVADLLAKNWEMETGTLQLTVIIGRHKI